MQNGLVIEKIDRATTRLAGASPQEIILWAFNEFADKLTIATGFGAEGMVLIDMAVKISSHPNIFFVDTGFLFPETYSLRRHLEEHYQIKLRAISTSLTPELQEQLYGPQLWSINPDLCCQLRKVAPLEDALNGFDAWMTAIRRSQTKVRANANEVEWDSQRQLFKINPLVQWSKKDVWNYIAANKVPYNPLHDQGYPSIGCTHCTRAIGAHEDERAGRWPTHAKTECGIHLNNELLTKAIER
ncbi:MAG: phosphoadenylyl-sulfate reductase [Acidobacteriota bacterium]